jgi:hypothetical protein
VSFQFKIEVQKGEAKIHGVEVKRTTGKEHVCPNSPYGSNTMSLGCEDCGLKEGENKWLAPAEIHVFRDKG